jgi:hypothetical protein
MSLPSAQTLEDGGDLLPTIGQREIADTLLKSFTSHVNPPRQTAFDPSFHSLH